jgi:hypothetical protein
MQVFLDNFAAFGTQKAQVELFLKKCKKTKLSLNLAKCAFVVTSGHIANKDGVAMDRNKV